MFRLLILTSSIILASSWSFLETPQPPPDSGRRSCISFNSLQAVCYKCLFKTFHDDEQPTLKGFIYETNRTIVNNLTSFQQIDRLSEISPADITNVVDRKINVTYQYLDEDPRLPTSHLVTHVDDYLYNLLLMCDEDRNVTLTNKPFDQCVADEVEKGGNPLNSYPHGPCFSESDVEAARVIANNWKQLICEDSRRYRTIVHRTFYSVGMWLTLLPKYTIIGPKKEEMAPNPCLTHATWRSMRTLWMEECDALYNLAMEKGDSFQWVTYQDHLTRAVNTRLSCIRRLFARRRVCDANIVKHIMLTLIYAASPPGMGYLDYTLADPNFRPTPNPSEICPERVLLGTGSTQFVISYYGGPTFCPKYTNFNTTILSTDRMLVQGQFGGIIPGLFSISITYFKEGSNTQYDAVYRSSVDPIENVQCAGGVDCDAEVDRLVAKLGKKGIEVDAANHFHFGVDESLAEVRRELTILNTQILHKTFLSKRKDVGNELIIKSHSIPGSGQRAIEIYDTVGQTVVSLTATQDWPRLHLLISMPVYVLSHSHGFIISGCPTQTLEDHNIFIENLENEVVDEPKILEKCREKSCVEQIGRDFLYNACMALCLGDRDSTEAKNVANDWLIEARMAKMSRICTVTDRSIPLGTSVASRTTLSTSASFLATVLALCLR